MKPPMGREVKSQLSPAADVYCNDQPVKSTVLGVGLKELDEVMVNVGWRFRRHRKAG